MAKAVELPDSFLPFMVSRTMRLLAPLGLLMVTLGSCDRGAVFSPPAGTTFNITLTGRIADGSDLAGSGIPGQVAVLAADGSTPVLVDDDNLVDTDGAGVFSASFQAVLAEPVIVLEASAGAPFLPARHAYVVDAGPVDATLYVSSTLLSGRVLGLDGVPETVDIWVMRDDGAGNFLPYAIAGGRDFIPPVPESGVDFGIDTDVLGRFAIPVRIPDADFRLVFVVDTNTDRFESVLTDLFVTRGSNNTVPTITLAPLDPPAVVIGGSS